MYYRGRVVFSRRSWPYFGLLKGACFFRPYFGLVVIVCFTIGLILALYYGVVFFHDVFLFLFFCLIII